MALGTVKTGPSAGIKADAQDASKLVAAEKKAEQEKAEAQANDLKEGQICYIKPGEPTFNCFSEKLGIKINFAGGRYFVSPDDPDREDIINTLEYHVKRGTIVKEVG